MSKKKTKEKLQIIPLGGVELIGMNMTAFCYGDSIIVVDCGRAFSSPTDMKTISGRFPMS